MGAAHPHPTAPQVSSVNLSNTAHYIGRLLGGNYARVRTPVVHLGGIEAWHHHRYCHWASGQIPESLEWGCGDRATQSCRDRFHNFLEGAVVGHSAASSQEDGVAATPAASDMLLRGPW